MHIKPVVELGNWKHYLWELSDIPLPEDLTKILKESEWVPYNYSVLKHSPKRFVAKKFNKDLFSSIFTDINYYLNNNTDYNVKTTWPFDSGKHYSNAQWGIDVIKDTESFHMEPHLDNNLMFATCVINVVDNEENTTEYFHDEYGKELMYKSPGKKGTGVLHINSPYLYHSASNNSQQDRIILLNNLKISAVINNGHEI